MPLLIRGILALCSMGLVLQLDCGTFLTLTGCLPELEPLLEALPFITGDGTTTDGPTTLEPTTQTTTSGIFLVVENNTAFDIEVTFEADGKILLANVGAGQSQKFEVAPTDANNINVGDINLDGLWQDSITTQKLTFEGNALKEFVDENGKIFVFEAADVTVGNELATVQGPQFNSTAGTLEMIITSTDSAAGTQTIRQYSLAPNTTLTSMTGTSQQAQVDASGEPVEGSGQTLNHAFARTFPKSLMAVSERDFNPTTGALVQDFTYDPPPAEVTLGTGPNQYQLGDTVRFRVNASTVTFLVD